MSKYLSFEITKIIIQKYSELLGCYSMIESRKIKESRLIIDEENNGNDALLGIMSLCIMLFDESALIRT